MRWLCSIFNQMIILELSKSLIMFLSIFKSSKTKYFLTRITYKLGNAQTRYFKQCLLVYNALTNYFMKISLYVRRCVNHTIFIRFRLGVQLLHVSHECALHIQNSWAAGRSMLTNKR